MRFFRLAATVVLSLLIVSGATAATRSQSVGKVALAAPLDVHGFLLTADDDSTTTFPRTPSFAWTPVPGANRYEFQLATSRTYASGALLARKSTPVPAVALAFALPWISGAPYSLYARVRGIGPDGTTGPWSESYGFNMRWVDVPTQEDAPAGLIRWTPVRGATGYQVWYLDPNRIFRTDTNVADEREYYTFHQDPSWTGVVHWRIRALRSLYGLNAGGTGRNGLPAVSYGPWSSTYSTTNTPFVSGPLVPTKTISDTITTAALNVPHHLMPAFIFSGDTVDGIKANLYRVFVATDRDCVNIVFSSAVVGGPAYAPRWAGTLSLPQDPASQFADQSNYVAPGSEGLTSMADGTVVTANEAIGRPGADAGPIMSGEDDSPWNPDTGSTADAGVTPPPAPNAQPTFPQASLPVDAADSGPPLDLWDVDPSTGRYFWTVVPVGAFTKPSLSTTLSATAPAGAPTISVTGGDSLAIGDILIVGVGPSAETVSVVDTSGSLIAIAPALKNTHGVGDTVFRAGGSLTYRDMQLPQDACNSGRVLSFGRTSETALAARAAKPYASGLSPTGKLVSASSARPTFYGAPLVSWVPALAASAYEVQWSKTLYPFTMAATPILTYGTSALLPLTAGSWYYRVRGINLGLPVGGRAMAWSEALPITISQPKFKIVAGNAGGASTTQTFDKGTFTLDLPKTWRELSSKGSRFLFLAKDPAATNGTHASAGVSLESAARGQLTLDQWGQAIAASMRKSGSGPVGVTVVHEPAGAGVRLTYHLKVSGKPMSFVEYVLDAGSNSYVLTFVSSTSAAPRFAKVFGAAARAFSIS